ncbi:hypothetical protein QW131_03485 [Roseibium salinum]|nr:hypothetical protein [Roseibium salinum]
MLLATEVAARGKRVTIFDADPQKWITRWYELPNQCPGISVVSEFSPASLTEQILQAAECSDYVVVDLEGTEKSDRCQCAVRIRPRGGAHPGFFHGCARRRQDPHADQEAGKRSSATTSATAWSSPAPMPPLPRAQ